MNRPISEVAREEGISEATLYNWRKAVREKGLPVPGSSKSSENWSAEAKQALHAIWQAESREEAGESRGQSS